MMIFNITYHTHTYALGYAHATYATCEVERSKVNNIKRLPLIQLYRPYTNELYIILFLLYIFSCFI